MAFINPERVVFESTDDIIDYVSKGIAPRRKDFNKVIRCINEPMTDDEIESASSNDVVIPDNIFIGIDKEQFKDVLTRVYRNNCRKRNGIVIGISAGVVMAIALGIRHAHKEAERDDRINEYIDRYVIENSKRNKDY